MLSFLEGRLPPNELTAAASHALTCQSCQRRISAQLAAGSVSRPAREAGGDAMANAELSCRFLVPYLALAKKQLGAAPLNEFLAAWRTSVTALGDEAAWVTRRFCEALTEWLAERVGMGAIIAATLRESYSPETMGLLYPFVRAFGSPAVGYARVPSFVRLLNRASDVDVRMHGRNRATITYRPHSESTREQSPLICQVRRAQIAAGPTIWGLPLAIVEEAECQALGGDRCVYQVTWVEPTRWWRSLFGGFLVAAAAFLASGHNWVVSALAMATTVTGIHLWGARRDLNDQRMLADLKMDMLRRVRRLRPDGGPLEPDPAAKIELSTPTETEPLPEERAAALEGRLPALPQTGQLLAGRYRLGPLLGAGGMGFVFSTTDETTNQTIALKVLRPELSAPRWIERMEREVRIARLIDHPHVCKVMSFGQVGGHCFLTMELARGTLLNELRSKAAARSWDIRVSDAQAIVQGLLAIHRAGIVHRDLTPQNILRFPEGRLAIADFGLAIDEPAKTTNVAGTPNRIAPEVLKGEKASFASDVWQLGMLLEDVLFGREAVTAELGEPARDADRDEGARQAWSRLCAACTNVDPTRRPESAEAVAGRLP